MMSETWLRPATLLSKVQRPNHYTTVPPGKIYWHTTIHTHRSNILSQNTLTFLTFSRLIRSCCSFCCNLASEVALAFSCSSSSFKSLFWPSRKWQTNRKNVKDSMYDWIFDKLRTYYLQSANLTSRFVESKSVATVFCGKLSWSSESTTLDQLQPFLLPWVPLFTLYLWCTRCNK